MMKLKAKLVLEVLVFSSISVIVPSAVSVADQDVKKNYDFPTWFLWVLCVVSYFEERT